MCTYSVLFGYWYSFTGARVYKFQFFMHSSWCLCWFCKQMPDWEIFLINFVSRKHHICVFFPASVMCAVCSSFNDVWKKMSNGIFQRGPAICTEHIDAMVMLWLKDANTVNVNPLMSERDNLQNSFRSVHLQPRQEIRTGSWDLQTWFIH